LNLNLRAESLRQELMIGKRLGIDPVKPAKRTCSVGDFWRMAQWCS
jgi:hypothetical protein